MESDWEQTGHGGSEGRIKQSALGTALEQPVPRKIRADCGSRPPFIPATSVVAIFDRLITDKRETERERARASCGEESERECAILYASPGKKETVLTVVHFSYT